LDVSIGSARSDALGGQLSIVIPALNEERGLGTMLPELMTVARERGFEVIVVDDGSDDRTHAVASELGATVIRHARRRGYGAALKTGIRAAGSAYVAIMDGDGQHTLKALAAVLAQATDADMVVGARPGLADTALWRRPGKWVIVRLASYLARQKLPDLNSGLRVMRRDILERYLHLCPDGFSFTTTLTLAYIDRGRSVRYVPIAVERPLSRSTVSIATGLDALLLVLRLGTLFAPLRLFVSVSLALAAAGVLWAIPYALQGRGVSIGAALLVLAGIQILFAGLLADQISTLRKERLE
jgi:glycosyltransferase involved in cell wall biosynthesis